MDVLHIISIFFEAVVIVLGVLLALVKKKNYGWCIALAFAIYVFYDIASMSTLEMPQALLTILFFIATISILWAVWRVYQE